MDVSNIRMVIMNDSDKPDWDSRLFGYERR
jgi:hypothetical protein